jgi:hypothetical protein
MPAVGIVVGHAVVSPLAALQKKFARCSRELRRARVPPTAGARRRRAAVIAILATNLPLILLVGNGRVAARFR